jgi:hypothetical protein
MSRQRRGLWWAAFLIVGFVTISAARAGASTTLDVRSDVVWTDTHVAVRVGDQVTMQGRGRIHFGNRPINSMAPAGVPWGEKCDAATQIRGHWPAPGVACWSLIGRVGAQGTPFEVGAARTLTFDHPGELYLGVNDNLLSDNRGTWSASVAVVSAPAPAPAKSTSSSSAAPWILIALGALVLVAALITFWVRRNRPAPVTFTLAPELLAASINIRVDGDGSVYRLDGDGNPGALMLVEDDFDEVNVDRTLDSFVWRGLELRVVRGRRTHGEAFQLGQCVAGSEGTKPTSDGYTKGVLPVNFAGGWAFTLRTFEGDTATGTWKIFASGNEPFEQQANAAIESIPKLVAALPTLTARRAQSGLLHSRIGH